MDEVIDQSAYSDLAVLRAALIDSILTLELGQGVEYMDVVEVVDRVLAKYSPKTG